MEPKDTGTSADAQLIANSLADYGQGNPIKSGKYAAKRIFSGEKAQITEIAFDAGVELADHMARTPILVNVIEGEVDFRVGGDTHRLSTGGSVFVEANVMHAVLARQRARITVTFLSS
ncbi:cupin domain-containing protein [Glutamicibacter sp.]|uniref:cupin domain-containing protein n=1 Tax=Glutamicibacter sp. TaxID=1931995 RepID=UPI0028BD713F|nr:cupin domain-containing protein [Glutamicibacter sp.]